MTLCGRPDFNRSSMTLADESLPAKGFPTTNFGNKWRSKKWSPSRHRENQKRQPSVPWFGHKQNDERSTVRGRVFGFLELAGRKSELQWTLQSRQFQKTKHPTPV